MNHRRLPRNGQRKLKWETRKDTIISCLILIVLCQLGVFYLMLTEEKIVSPVSDNPTWVIKPTPTPVISTKWSNVIKLITDEFESEGPQVVYQAISVAKNESGWKHNAYNWNTNSTADNCAFQINDVHIKRFGTKFKTDIKECIRVAHVIYKEQGWRPWVAARKLGYVN